MYTETFGSVLTEEALTGNNRERERGGFFGIAEALSTSALVYGKSMFGIPFTCYMFQQQNRPHTSVICGCYARA